MFLPLLSILEQIDIKVDSFLLSTPLFQPCLPWLVYWIPLMLFQQCCSQDPCVRVTSLEFKYIYNVSIRFHRLSSVIGSHHVLYGFLGEGTYMACNLLLVLLLSPLLLLLQQIKGSFILNGD